jgi:ElaB/YqjD/DUF883 family membrane-anchored ribosome-binding protein
MTSKNHRNASAQLRDKVGDVRQNLHDIGAIAQDAAKEKVSHLQNAVKEQASELRDTASRTAEDLRARAGDLRDEGMQQMRRMETTLEQRIRDKPLQSVAIAAGAGILLGILWIRR